MNHPKAYYNEIDPRCCAWLQKLMDMGLIMPGTIDNRSIEDVNPQDLAGYTRVGFFAGIGGWDLALQLAGWPEDKPVWHGSCPCQPFSTAGKGEGFADERHLWPAFHHLISQCQPPVVFGEQVASKDGLTWLDLVRADLEASGYAVGASDLCAASVGAPHIRQRLWWVADSIVQGLEGHRRHGNDRNEPGRFGAHAAGSVAKGGDVDGVGDADGERKGSIRGVFSGAGAEPDRGSKPDWMADADRSGSQPGRSSTSTDGHGDTVEPDGSHRWPSPLHGFWENADWLHCRDGKWRPVESAVLGMVDGLSNVLVPSGPIMPASFALAKNQDRRVMRLRGYGNAIVPQVAAEFVSAYLATLTP